MRKFFKTLLFLVIAVALPFILANEILRWTWYHKYSQIKIMRRDWSRAFALKPGLHEKLDMGMLRPELWKGRNAFWHLDTNSEGIRASRDLAALKPTGTFRIFCLGDSVTFGADLDYENSYPGQLEQLLGQEAAGEIKVEVIDAGVPGYTSRQELVLLDQQVLKYHPDLVILEFGLNDATPRWGQLLIPDRKFMRGDVKHGFKKIYQYPPAMVPELIAFQPLFMYAMNIGNLFLGMRFQQEISKLSESQKKMILSQKRTSLSSQFPMARVPPNDFFDNLLQMVWLSRQHNFRLLFYLPYGIPNAYHTLALSVANENRIPVVDFAGRLSSYKIEQLESNPDYNRLLAYYEDKLGRQFLEKNTVYLLTTDGGHPNAVGNRIIAEEITKVIGAYYGFPAKGK